MGKFFIPCDQSFTIKPGQWNGYALILPCVSVGNVPQMAAELLIYKFLKHQKKIPQSKFNDLELIGYILSENVHPYSGPDPFCIDGEQYSTSIQVFCSHSKKLIIIQQRSPIYKECREKFYSELLEWLAMHRFKLILILSSSFDHFLAPEYVSDYSKIPIMYLPSDLDPSIQSLIEQKLKIKPVIKVDPLSMKPSENGRIHLPGSGSARSYFKHFSRMNDSSHKSTDKDKTNILCLIMFCSEGDNRYHSFRLADTIADILLDCHNSETLKIDQIKSTKKDLDLLPEGDEDEQFVYQKFFLDRYRWDVPQAWSCIFGNGLPEELNIYG